jgi:hypothetical protein
LWSTLGPKPREKIAGITNIKLADEKLLEWREYTSWPDNCELWSNWTSVRLDKSMSPAAFVAAWQDALKYLQASAEEISTFVQLHVFMEAISDDPHFTNFDNSLLRETYGTLSMPSVIARFLCHMTRR